jgi:predicted nucleotidyltransferase
MRFPSQTHGRVAELFTGFCENRKIVDTVLVVNSCARGRATVQSDLDMAALVGPGTSAIDVAELEESWTRFASRNALVAQLMEMGPFCKLHIDFFDGQFVPAVWDEGGGPDTFEIEIGNRIAHSSVMREPGPYFKELSNRWLPYYENELRTDRLGMVRRACAYHLDYVKVLHERSLHFHAFDQLYKAF